MNLSTAIVVGAGVTGLSTAFHLARKRFGKVVLLDKGPIGDGSSSRAAGIATGLLWSETGVLARKKSLELFRRFSEELDGYTYQNVGSLNLFDAASWPEREALLPLYQRCGAPFEVLDGEEMRRRWPALEPRADFVGLFDPHGGYSEPDEYISALAAKVRELGVEIREFCPVTDFMSHNGRVTGVHTAQGDIEGDAVVVTTYAWTLKVLESLAVKLPMKSFVHQRYVTKPFPEAIKIPAVNANPLGGYLRPARDNCILIGVETAEREEHRVAASDFHLSTLTAPSELKEHAKAEFSSLLPALRHAEWQSEKVGLITFSMDGEPILGPVTSIPGLYVGTAFHSGGFSYNPVTGLLLAEFVADGKTSMDVSAFSLERFSTQETEKHLAATIAQKDAVQRRH